MVKGIHPFKSCATEAYLQACLHVYPLEGKEDWAEGRPLRMTAGPNSFIKLSRIKTRRACVTTELDSAERSK
jgi:hypothetical protein